MNEIVDHFFFLSVVVVWLISVHPFLSSVGHFTTSKVIFMIGDEANARWKLFPLVFSLVVVSLFYTFRFLFWLPLGKEKNKNSLN